jgi:hypothetical protein
MACSAFGKTEADKESLHGIISWKDDRGIRGNVSHPEVLKEEGEENVNW